MELTEEATQVADAKTKNRLLMTACGLLRLFLLNNNVFNHPETTTLEITNN